MPHLSVVIPVYQAEGCLVELHRRLGSALEALTPDYEIIFVEDCGEDCSWDLICDFARNDRRVKGLQMSRNFGQHYAITAGLAQSQGDWVVIMDCDLQDAPEEIPRLYSKALQGYPVVVARRQQRTDAPLKLFATLVYYKVFRYLADLPHYDGQVGTFRIVSRRVVEAFGQMGERLRFFAGMIEWMGFPTAAVDVIHGERFSGRSSYGWRKLLKLARDAIVAYSNKPLRLAVGLGMGISAISFALGSYLIVRKFTHGIPIAGWTSLIVSVYFMGGLTLILIGVLGIYLGEAFDTLKKRPLYIISRTTADKPLAIDRTHNDPV